MAMELNCIVVFPGKAFSEKTKTIQKVLVFSTFQISFKKSNQTLIKTFCFFIKKVEIARIQQQACFFLFLFFFCAKSTNYFKYNFLYKFVYFSSIVEKIFSSFLHNLYFIKSLIYAILPLLMDIFFLVDYNHLSTLIFILLLFLLLLRL